ncbi:MAG TPA: phage/plasmid primase, P4 family [Gallionellaceae bacterium]|nr:phage/plasmid primase, P4 family [Gallionellaceae bacterium]
MNEREKISPELAFAMMKKSEDFAVKNNIPFRWAGTHWQEVQLLELEREALFFIAKKEPAKANERTAASSAKTAILFGEKLGVPDHTFIPTLNGYIQVDGDLVKHTPANKGHGITYVLECAYDPLADCPIFKNFLAEALPNQSVRDFIQEYAGYTLLGDARHQLAAWLIGNGGTGKGTFVHIMSALHRQTVALSINSLDGFKLTGLQSASLVCVDETPSRIDEERLKTLVSGDAVQIDRKYRDAITIRPTAKWIICGNALPSISDQSDGFWRRWFVFPFNIKPKVKTPLLAETIIQRELSGVLNWALLGLQRLLAREAFPALPEAMREAAADGKRQSNSVAEWVEDDGILFDDEVKNTRADVYSRYKFWCGESGSKVVGSPKFWERMRQIFSHLPEDRNSARETVGGKRKAMVHLAIPFS